ncbi:MAG: DUF2232 domain-containing protein [Woeseia sp.]|nr:DUF2232 domain-containing protein [Woeseia sp.]
MRPIAGWLTARPWNAVLGLSLSLLLPFAPVLSGAVMVLLVLANGLQRAALLALAAAAILAATFALFRNPVPPILMSALLAWVPVSILAVVLGRTGSLTLVLQVTVILALLATLGFHLVLGDPTGFWITKLGEVAATFKQMGFLQQAAVLETQRELIAPQMTVVFVFTVWSILVLVLVLGYALYQQLPERSGRFGRFGDLHFGRVLALAMAITSMLALFISASWLQNLAFVLFAIFWLQGLSLVHWLHSDGPLPMLVVVAVYVMLPFLNALLIMMLAVLGYTDAWFNFRPRISATRKAK